MRVIVLHCLLALAACAASPKRPSSREPTGPTFLVGAKEPYVAFDAPGWHRSQTEDKDMVLLHWHDHKGDRGVAIWIKDADPGSTVEAAMTKFAAMILAVPVLFSEVQASPVQALSEEEATFGFRGVDSKTNVPMAALCRVKLVAGRSADYWALILTYGPEAQAPQMLFEADAIAKSLRIVAPDPPPAIPQK